MIDEVFRGENDFRQAVAVEVVQDQRVDEVGLIRGNDLHGQNRPESRFALSCFDGQVGGIDTFDRRQAIARSVCRPIHHQLTLDNGALRARWIG